MKEIDQYHSKCSVNFSRRECRFVSLQKEIPINDVAELEKHSTVWSFDQELGEDFLETAALISHLDLVIAVDTAVAHLAGALGKEVWILLPLRADWRWLRNRTDTPWYPTATLFRQRSPGDWATVIHEVKEKLARLTSS